MKVLAVPIMVVLACAVVSVTHGQTGGPYSLAWNTLSSGGGAVSSGPYQMRGSIGQPDAGRLTGGSYVLNGGFWIPGAPGTVSADPGPDPVPRTFSARAPAPNPFRESTVLAIELPERRPMRVAVFGVDGRLVRLLMNSENAAGRHRVVWNGLDDHGRATSAGLYFARITAGEFSASHRIVRLD